MHILEEAQAGLSWLTILKKRENYGQAFDQFEIEKKEDSTLLVQQSFMDLCRRQGWSMTIAPNVFLARKF